MATMFNHLKNYSVFCYNRKIRQRGAVTIKPGETELNTSHPKAIIRQWPGKYLIQVGGHTFSLRRFLTESPEFTIGEKGKPATRKGLYYNEKVTIGRGQFGRFKELNRDASFPTKAFSLLNLGNGKILIKQHGALPVTIQMEKINKPKLEAENPIEANAARLREIIQRQIMEFIASRPGFEIEDPKDTLFSLKIRLSEEAGVLPEKETSSPYLLSLSVTNNKLIGGMSFLGDPGKEIVAAARQSVDFYNKTSSGHYVFVSPDMPEWFYYRINKG